MSKKTILTILLLLKTLTPQLSNRCRCNPSEDKPVCSIQNITYKNRCIMSCIHKDTLKHIGRCKTNCPCPPISEQPEVCGKNGKKYKSLCLLKCANTTSVPCGLEEGICEEECSFVRGRVVCATNGVTYRNFCFLECAGATFLHFEECRNCDEECRFVKGRFVCATNGVTYRNHCFMECAGAKFLHLESCRVTDLPGFPEF